MVNTRNTLERNRMIYFGTTGSRCSFPRRPYNASELPAEHHTEVLERMRRAALRDMRAAAATPDKRRERIKTRKQQLGLLERAEEAAGECYVHWLSLRDAAWCSAGDHARAVSGTIRYMRLSSWKGRTGAYRAVKRAVTAERLAMIARLRQRNVPTPAQLAEWAERLPADGGAGGLRAQRRRAERLAEGLGLAVEGLARLANGLAIEAGALRPQHTGQTPPPLPLPLPVGAHCPWSVGCDRSATTY
jgi:hypothetical protein